MTIPAAKEKKMNDRHHDPIHGYTDSVAALARDQAADRALKAAIAADRDAEEVEWTAEVTTARRATWNALVRSLPRDRRVTAMQVKGLEEKAGFTLDALKTHIARHRL